MTFEKYALYTLTEFLEDDSFIQWVTTPDARSNLFWKTFLINYPEKESVVREASSVIRVYRKQSDFHNEQHREEVWNRINVSLSHAAPKSANVITLLRYRKLAASIILLFVCIAAFWMWDNKTNTITTSNGEVKAITLPDQSIVMLNGNSVLTYKDTWDGNVPREVWIQGEAYFDVKHINKDTTTISPGDRFIVHGKNLDIQVLGTSFNVNSRRNKTKIALLTGKIEVSYADPSAPHSGGLVLLPGEYVEYTGQKLLMKKILARPHKVATWTVREITFTDPSLNDIMETLQDNYGYSIHVEDQELMSLKIEGEISVTTVPELLALVSSTLGITIEESGMEIRIAHKHK